MQGVNLQQITAWKQLLYQEALSAGEELVQAALQRYGAMPDAEQLSDFLDFFAVEWVDAEGYTLVERLVQQGRLPAEAARWSAEVQTALWVVDEWVGPQVLLRDVGGDREIAVWAPGLTEDLPPRTVLKARVIPVGAAWVLSGQPDVYGTMGVLARLDLLREWRSTPEPALIDQLASLRAGFRQQREERDAWLAFFGSDEVVFEHAADLERRLAAFVRYLFEEHPFASLGGQTRAATWQASQGKEPVAVEYQLGPTLQGPGRPAVIYDPVAGAVFLPAFGEFRDHLRGHAEHPDVVRLYVEEPEISLVPFERAGGAERLAEFLGVPTASFRDLLRPYKDVDRRAIPGLLPGGDGAH